MKIVVPSSMLRSFEHLLLERMCLKWVKRILMLFFSVFHFPDPVFPLLLLHFLRGVALTQYIMCFISLFPIPHSIHNLIYWFQAAFLPFSTFWSFLFLVDLCISVCHRASFFVSEKKKTWHFFPSVLTLRFTCVSVILAPCFRICLPLFSCHFFFFLMLLLPE